ncbi:hypothetical protein A1O1_07028 [Capronia coronata CBS 617.96]|uniref:Ecp2 effector protein domain-containing protein n=1 Tax=Capronia coronata CBS 617.96 TaxID=1182541 RepID=W9Y1B7_9EURO|nr:uncharacterized protein A1O1_07028 [Capronia coronata CBS 617.96]EXJ83405.1 hypothetical protein A1O1_07028 [Capronia coronata CBS 617.96]
MARSISLSSLVFILAVLILPISCRPQVNQETISPSITTTYTHTKTYTGSPICNTSGSDWHMDPPTAMRLADLFCEDLAKPENYPVEGAEFSSVHLPTELTQEMGSANYTEIELSGLIAAGSMSRSKTWWADGVIYIEGTDEQCERDNCTGALRSTINRCEWNHHYVGGDNFFMSDFGVYTIFVANCSGNWLDRRCEKWHAAHPNVGLSRNDSLATPGLLPPSSNVTATGSTTQTPPVTATITLSTFAAGG